MRIKPGTRRYDYDGNLISTSYEYNPRPAPEILADIGRDILSAAHSGLMAVTPDEYEDDVNAAIYYGTFGLYDVSNVADVPFWKSKGFTTKSAISFMLMRAFVPAAIIGWWIDPADKREGGLAESDWYQTVTDPGYWIGPGKWYALD